MKFDIPQKENVIFYCLKGTAFLFGILFSAYAVYWLGELHPILLNSKYALFLFAATLWVSLYSYSYSWAYPESNLRVVVCEKVLGFYLVKIHSGSTLELKKIIWLPKQFSFNSESSIKVTINFKCEEPNKIRCAIEI